MRWDASEAPAGTSSPHHSCLTVCGVHIYSLQAESAFLYCSARFEAVIRAPRISKPVQGVRGRLAEAIEVSAEAWSIMVGLVEEGENALYHAVQGRMC